MPVGNYRWLKQTEIDQLDFSSMTDFQDTGYIVQCDISYPEKLHQSHNSLPLCPEHKTITEKDLSPYSKEMYEKLRGNVSKYKAKKLVSSFEKKKNYVTHYSNLQFYIKQGLIVNNVSKVLAFDQSPYLAKYMDFCTEQRRLATNTFDKNLMKLLANSCFGKTIENVRKYQKCYFARSEKRATQLNSNPLINQVLILENDLSIHFCKQRDIELDKPFATGK